jgi:lipopolysaccharide export system protein LptC
MRGGGIVTRYRLGWLGLVVLAVAATLLLVFGRQVAPVPLEDVKPSIAPPDRSVPEFQEKPFADLIVNMSELELSLSSSDGALKLRIWATKADKTERGYELEDGVLQFAMEERGTLVLRVQEATFTIATDTVELSGSLVGQIMSNDQADDRNRGLDNYQYFEATKLIWNLNEDMVHTDKVVYRAPNIDVSGERMTLDLSTRVVTFEGKVEAGVGKVEGSV